jgi:hypothetical protein
VKLGQTEGVGGYHSFRVVKSEVISCRDDNAVPASDNPGIAGTVSLAEFGRSIGLRDQKHLNALVKAGLLEVTEMINPMIGRKQLRVGAPAEAAFRARFATVNMLAAETGEQPQAIRHRLARSGLSEFKKDGTSFGNLWLRSEVEATTW